MTAYYAKNGSLLFAMTEAIEHSKNKEAMAQGLSTQLVACVADRFSAGRRIKSSTMAD